MSQHGSPVRAKSPSRSPAHLGARKAQKVKKASSHPQYKEMIRDALTNLKEKNGSSLQKILGYILSNYNMTDASEAQVNSRLKFALRSGVKHGSLARNVEGVGVTGKFRITKGGLTANRKRRRSAKKGKGRKRRSRKRRSPKRKTKRSRKAKRSKKSKKTKRRRSPAKRRRRRRAVKRRARKVRVTRRRRKVKSPRRRRRRSVVRRRRARR